MSKGINVYDEVRRSFGTINESREMEKRAASDKPCIFLSHKSEDKEPVREIGEYIMNQDINIYLDADDPELIKADSENDHAKVTLFIERGIQCSSDIMVLISEQTQKSWWVPFEIGYGKCAGKELVCQKLKGLVRLPSYLSIVNQLQDRTDLKGYLESVKARLIKKAHDDQGSRPSPFLRLTAILEDMERAKAPNKLELYLD